MSLWGEYRMVRDMLASYIAERLQFRSPTRMMPAEKS